MSRPKALPDTKGYTWMQTISGFFGVLAYVIGAVVGNYVLIYSGVVIVVLFSIVPILFVEEPRELRLTTGDQTGSEKKKGNTHWRELFRIYIAHGLSWIGVQTMFVYIIAYIQQKMNLPSDPELASRASGQVISISFAILNTVGFLLPALVLEPLAKRFGRVRVHTAAVATMAVGYGGIVVAGSTPLALYIMMAVLGIGWASIVSLPFAIMTEQVEKSRMGYFMGIFNLSVVLPQLFVSLVLGFVIQQTEDKSIIFMISCATLALSAIVWLIVREAGTSNSQVAPAASAQH